YVFKITGSLGSFTYIHDLKIRGTSVSSPATSKPAIYCKSTGVATDFLRFERVAVELINSDGIYIDGDNPGPPGGGTVDGLTIRDCNSLFNNGRGIFLQDVTDGYILGTETNGNAKAEPRRDSRRLHSLRGWGHGTTEQVLPRGPRAGGPDGLGA